MWSHLFYCVIICIICWVFRNQNNGNSPIFPLGIWELPNTTVVVTKASFDERNSHRLLYFSGGNNTTQEQELHTTSWVIWLFSEDASVLKIRNTCCKAFDTLLMCSFCYCCYADESAITLHEWDLQLHHHDDCIKTSDIRPPDKTSLVGEYCNVE